MSHWLKKLGVGAVACIVLVLVGLGIAYASIPAPDGTVNGCYKNSTGDLRVIDSAASCPSGYTALNWNQTGPQGPAGPAGLSGYEVVVVTQDVTLSEPAGRSPALFANCPSPKKVLGGGATVNLSGLGLVTSQANPTATGWEVIYQRFVGTENPVQITVRAICAVVS